MNEAPVPENKKDLIVDEVIADMQARRLQERRKWRWSVIKATVLLLPVLLLVSVSVLQNGSNLIQEFSKPYVAVVELSGPITVSGRTSSRTMIEALNTAYSDQRAKGILIRINSGGGSATQSSLIRDHIDRLKKLHPEKRVVAVAEETMASGAYLVACGADTIYAHPSTLTGSIGAKMETWGLSEALHKLGVERRVFAAGENKTFLSEYETLSPTAKEKALALVHQIHEQFIGYVKTGRGDRLRGEASVMFSGEVFLGTQAQEIGLVDKLGGIEDALKDEFQVSAIKNYSRGQTFFTQIQDVGASVIADAIILVQERTGQGVSLEYRLD